MTPANCTMYDALLAAENDDIQINGKFCSKYDTDYINVEKTCLGFVWFIVH